MVLGGQSYTYDLSLMNVSFQLADFDEKIALYTSRENHKVSLRMARFLIDNGADVDEPDYGGT